MKLHLLPLVASLVTLALASATVDGNAGPHVHTAADALHPDGSTSRTHEMLQVNRRFNQPGGQDDPGYAGAGSKDHRRAVPASSSSGSRAQFKDAAASYKREERSMGDARQKKEQQEAHGGQGTKKFQSGAASYAANPKRENVPRKERMESPGPGMRGGSDSRCGGAGRYACN